MLSQSTQNRRVFILITLLCMAGLLLSACQSPTHLTSTPVQTGGPPVCTTPSPTIKLAIPTTKPTSTLPPIIVPTMTPMPEQLGYFLQVREDDWVSGPMTATVTIIVYSDFECSACVTVAGWLKQIRQDYKHQVRVVFRHFPLLANHEKAWLAAQASEAAGQQGSFWEMHNLLFQEYQAWIGGTAVDTRNRLEAYARRLGLDINSFDLDNPECQSAVLNDYEEALANELPGTPTLYVNNELFQAPLNYFWLDAMIRLELLKSEQYSAAPKSNIDPNKRYTAIIKTEKGDIVIELALQQAPITVNNFVFLARQGWYDGVSFFRVLPGYIAQSGDPTDTGLGGPGYELPPEIGLTHTKGAIAMARRPDQTNPQKLSNGSQFFITLSPLRELDKHYTVFGYVTQGALVLSTLEPRDPDIEPESPRGDQVITIEIQEKPGLGEIH